MLIEENNAGRPFGGIGWAIRKNIKYHEIKFINDHISIIKLNNTTIIGVYLQCNYNTKDSYNQHLHDISKLEGILNMIDNRENIMLIGDFNSDPQRKSKFDALIRKLFEKYDLIMLKNKKSISNNEKIFTFTGNNNSSSNIDHIIMNKEISMLNPKFQIVDSIMKTSDHKSIHCQDSIPQIFELIKNHIIFIKRTYQMG